MTFQAVCFDQVTVLAWTTSCEVNFEAKHKAVGYLR